MNRMTKMLLAAFAIAGIALGTAATASADEADFIGAVSALDYYAIDCPGCAQDAVDVGYRACAGFDRGGSQAAVRAVLDSYNGPGQSHADYYASLFAQAAAYNLCPEHQNEIGQI